MLEPPRCLIIPAAGLGTRMKLVYPWLPKEMLLLGAKPAIHYALEEARHAGIEHVVVILHRGKQIVRRYLEEQRTIKITILYQQALAGEADAIALAEPMVNHCSIAILYPDNIYLPEPGAIKMLSDIHVAQQSDIVALSWVTEANEAAVSNSGKVDLEPIDETVFRVLNLLPKGPGYYQRRYEKELRACGMMVAGPHLFDAIRRTRPRLSQGEFTDEPVRQSLIHEGGLLGLRLPGTVFDIGNPGGYRSCLEQLNRTEI